MAENTDYDIEYRLADRPIWVAAHGRGLYDAAGNLVRVHGVVHDVTERKRAEEELREADRKKDEFLAPAGPRAAEPAGPDPQRPAGDAPVGATASVRGAGPGR